jgi:hypothetical protein
MVKIKEQKAEQLYSDGIIMAKSMEMFNFAHVNGKKKNTVCG